MKENIPILRRCTLSYLRDNVKRGQGLPDVSGGKKGHVHVCTCTRHTEQVGMRTQGGKILIVGEI